MKTTTIKLDRATRHLLDDYAASACLLRKFGKVPSYNLDGVEESIDLVEVALRMDKHLLKASFEELFPGYRLRRYNVDSGVATVEIIGDVQS